MTRLAKLEAEAARRAQTPSERQAASVTGAAPRRKKKRRVVLTAEQRAEQDAANARRAQGPSAVSRAQARRALGRES